MSWTRNRYDQCAYRKNLTQSVSELDWRLDPNQFYNCNPCRIEFGTFGGNNVSLSNENLVNVESELKNITRQLSTCPERKYLPSCEGCDTNEGLPCGSLSCRKQQSVRHMKSCNIIQYAPKINHAGFSLNYPGCPVENMTSVDGQKMQYQPYFNPITKGGNPPL